MSLVRSPRVSRPPSTIAAALLLAVVALLLAPATAASASEAPAAGWVRAGHLSPKTPDADIALTPLDGGKTEILRQVGYQDVTDYAQVPAGTYSVAVRPAGAPMSEAPMIRKSVRIGDGSATTVLAIGSGADARLQVVYDDLTPPADGQARVRLVSGAQQEVSARVENGPLLAEDVTTGSATGYAAVEAQTWAVTVTAGDATATNRVEVRAGGVYTLLALDDGAGGVSLAAVQDSRSSGTMPRGGVDTGAGGLAVSAARGSGAGSPGLGLLELGWLAAAGLAALALGGGVAATRRTDR